MANTVLRCPPRLEPNESLVKGRTSIGAAVFFALYGVPVTSLSQQPPPASPPKLEEIVVTASRRPQTLEEVPYNVSAISADQLSSAGVTDLASLAAQVPGLSLNNYGARYSQFSTPTIRGLNVSGGGIGGGGFAGQHHVQSPVGTYFGNVPADDGYFQLDDVERIEVLRGPQGSLYGAGALGGAIRIIAHEPELNAFGTRLDASAGSVAHASEPPYSASLMLNLPMGDTLALRLSGKYAFEPGFVTAYGILERQGPFLTAVPTLANPEDPVNSPGVFISKDNWGDQNTFTGRASVLWKPVENFQADATFLYANLNGDGSPRVNPTFPGGAYFVDPRIVFPAGGDYQTFSAVDQPYQRRTSLESLDMSYDAGFATLSSTTAYSKTDGLGYSGQSQLAALPFFGPYYAGLPVNPRFVLSGLTADADHTFTQELRLVSNAAETRVVDYVLGVFYENQVREGSAYTAVPGSYERAVEEGCTAPYFFGSAFPNCLPTVGPNDSAFVQTDKQSFKDKSVYGELSWHFTKKGQITFGGRHFQQDFTDTQSYLDYPFATFLPDTPHSAPASKNTWKVNPSYEYTQGQYVYATWSQGFRRGGANSVPLAGIFKESPLLAQYAPDSVNNYEIGLKGRFQNGTRYAIDAFDIEWDKPQIDGATPTGNAAVYNGDRARSRGFEFESSGPLLLSGLEYNLGAAYADAKLTKDFSLPANDGSGTIVPGALAGKAGRQLPGSPKFSGAAALTYTRSVAPNYGLTISVNGSYRSQVPLNLAASPLERPGFGIGNLWAALNHNSWTVGAYCTNIADKRVTLAPGPPFGSRLLTPLERSFFLPDIINQPRETGVRLSYSFEPSKDNR